MIVLFSFNPRYSESKEEQGGIKEEVCVETECVGEQDSLSNKETIGKSNEISHGSDEKRIPLSLPPKVKTDGSFKTYMSYKLISNMTSDQFKLQQQAYTDEYGFRRVGDAYCIALASAYGTEIGTRYYIVLETGVEFIGILSDCKQNIHTDSTNKYIEKNGNIIEWIVDTDKMDNLSKKMGDVSYAGFEGGVVSIERIEEVTE